MINIFINLLVIHLDTNEVQPQNDSVVEANVADQATTMEDDLQQSMNDQVGIEVINTDDLLGIRKFFNRFSVPSSLTENRIFFLVENDGLLDITMEDSGIISNDVEEPMMSVQEMRSPENNDVGSEDEKDLIFFIAENKLKPTNSDALQIIRNRFPNLQNIEEIHLMKQMKKVQNMRNKMKTSGCKFEIFFYCFVLKKI